MERSCPITLINGAILVTKTPSKAEHQQYISDESKREGNTFPTLIRSNLRSIFGKKGSGKSTYMVKLMLRYLKTGWLVYTDMADVIIPGVSIINPKHLENFAPDSNAVLFLGEVGITYDNRNFAKFPEGIRDLFKFERKYKFRCYMDSQS